MSKKEKCKSDFITTCQIITVVVGLILILVSFANGNYIDGITLIIVFGAFCFMLQVFVTIIDLLEEISKKLNK